jgi:L-ascorbate metabolism protein UlaG (beta-lactamase superfamily)
MVGGMSSVTLHRLADSCLIADTGRHSALFDPGFFAWGHDSLDLGSLPDIDRILVTHEHADHFVPDFVAALTGRYPEVEIQSNESVVGLLSAAGLAGTTRSPAWVATHDIAHEMIPTGVVPPNTGYTIDGVFTHPGDSFRLAASGPVLALPLMAPWGTATQAVELARRLRPRYVVPIHDWYLTPPAREWLYGLVAGVLAGDSIELVRLDHFASVTLDI